MKRINGRCADHRLCCATFSWHIVQRTSSVWLETGVSLPLPQIDYCNPTPPPILVPLNNLATLLTYNHDRQAWPQSSWMTSLPHASPQAKQTSSTERVVSPLTSGWHCYSESPLWNGSHLERAMSGLFCGPGHGATRSRVRHDHRVYLYPLWPLSHSQSGAALSTNRWRLALFSTWPQNFTVSLKNAAHRSATKEQIMRRNQQGMQWPFSCVNASSFSCSALHCSSPSQCLPECVTSHGSIFSRGELCCCVCLCWGGAMMKSFREIWYLVMEWTERKIL